MHIKLLTRYQYGVHRNYPVSDDAKLFAELVRKKTLDIPELILLKRLCGDQCRIEYVNDVDPTGTLGTSEERAAYIESEARRATRA